MAAFTSSGVKESLVICLAGVTVRMRKVCWSARNCSTPYEFVVASWAKMQDRVVCVLKTNFQLPVELISKVLTLPGALLLKLLRRKVVLTLEEIVIGLTIR